MTFKVMRKLHCFVFLKHRVCGKKDEMEDEKHRVVVLPYEKWEKFIKDSASIGMFSEAPKDESGKAAPAKATRLDDMLLVTASIRYYGLERSAAQAWLLTPISTWTGETYKALLDEVAIKNGLRSRGSHVGGVVSIRGREHVMAERIDVRPILPSQDSRMTIEEAQAYYDNKESGYFKEHHPVTHWEFVAGHPVVIFNREESDDRGPQGMLYYKGNPYSPRVCIEDLTAIRENIADWCPAPSVEVKPQPVQCCLF